MIGGRRIADGFVTSATVKRDLVSHLQNCYHLHVCAFGDGPLDLNMLEKADQAIIVVGEEQKRSKSMDAALAHSIRSGDLRAQQILLPQRAPPRLSTDQLPVMKLTDHEFIDSLLSGRRKHQQVRFMCPTKTTADLLATPMRNALVAGTSLKEAHRRVGWYLAVEFLADIAGLERSPIRHVLGQQTTGFQLWHERQTTIVALMRGGEPMAQGINDALPLAMFVHANVPEDCKSHHLDGQVTVILVDSVINTGKTIVEFIQHIRKIHATIRIVVVSGVVQAQCISQNILQDALASYASIEFVALRVSDTKFIGSGNTDTGNRLFNTTYLP